ncbi:MAG: cyclase family protein [Chloroflexota bacterium]|nr:cyclase family protein [Chloroflexota bacterium]
MRAQETSSTGLVPRGRVVDLTHVLLPGKEQYTLEVSRRNERHGAEGDIMSTVYMWSHVGTHVEAPLHFLADGGDTASIPIERLIGPAIVLDFRHKQTNEAISLEELQQAGQVERQDRVLIMTGRQDLYRTPASHDRPYLTEEAVRWLVEERQISCLGTDSSGFEVRGVSHYPNHRLLNTAGVPVLECLTNLTELRRQRVYLVALPWPVAGLDACPVRAVAIEAEE